jgi:SHS2 domain-containing protein
MHDDARHGVRPFDHTADIGIDVAAADLPELFTLAAIGMRDLIRGDDRGSASRQSDARTERVIELTSVDLPQLLANWLRELLYLHGVHGLAFTAAAFDRIDATGLTAHIVLHPDTETPVREIKGVTYHGLVAEPSHGGWTARVIFDV